VIPRAPELGDRSTRGFTKKGERALSGVTITISTPRVMLGEVLEPRKASS
jgi:hypothetical protein